MDDKQTAAPGNEELPVKRQARTKADVVEATETAVQEEAAPARDTSNDYGRWQYQPWKGVPHWVHPSGLSTFNRNEARKLKKL